MYITRIGLLLSPHAFSLFRRCCVEVPGVQYDRTIKQNGVAHCFYAISLDSQSLIKPDAEPLPPVVDDDDGKAKNKSKKGGRHKKAMHTDAERLRKPEELLEKEERREISGAAFASDTSNSSDKEGYTAVGAALLAVSMSALSLALGMWIGRATALRGQYTTLRV